MAHLKSKGHQVELIFDPGLDDNLFVRFKFLKSLNQKEALIEKAKSFKPDIIAFSIPTNLYPFVREILPRLKKELPVPVIAGGPHPTALPEYVLGNEHIDMVCIGEGEEAFAELLVKMEQGSDYTTTQNIWFKKDGEIIRNNTRNLIEDLDSLPFLEKESFYQYGCFSDNLEVVTGRGCPFRCTFCNIHFQRKLAKGKGSFIRKRSVESVIKELHHHLNKYNVKYITFHDDNFTTDPKWIEEFSEAYRREINKPFYCFANPTTVKKKIMDDLKNANCMQVFMGMDSGDPEIRQNLLKRPMSDDLILNASRTIRDAGIRLQVSAIFAFPDEQPVSMWKTIDLAHSTNPDLASGYIFYPFPQTELYEYAVTNGYLGEKEIQLVKSGDGGYHHGSILNHPNKRLAETLARLLPIYIKAPNLLKPLIRKLMRSENVRLAILIYLISIPIAFPFLGIEGVKVTLRMGWRAYIIKKKSTRQK